MTLQTHYIDKMRVSPAGDPSRKGNCEEFSSRAGVWIREEVLKGGGWVDK